jgi:hypothetical protein
MTPCAIMKYTLTLLTGLFLLAIVTSGIGAVTIRFADADFTNSPQVSTVTRYDLEIEVAGPMQTGLVSDPTIGNIQYSVSGTLDETPSGFPSFAFRLDHKFPSSPPITGEEFYALNPSSEAGGTLQYSISASADLSDGLQVSELDELPVNPAAGIGTGVVFHFNGREEGTGRYHPVFLQLRSDGKGILQNADNMGGVNPATMEVVDVDFGEEYITNLTFDASSLTIAVPWLPTITDFTYDSVDGIVNLAWTSRPNASYAVDISTDLMTWEELVSLVGSQGTSTSLEYMNVLLEMRAFFVVRELDQP